MRYKDGLYYVTSMEPGLKLVWALCTSRLRDGKLLALYLCDDEEFLFWSG
jgi:hypothetical protein